MSLLYKRVVSDGTFPNLVNLGFSIGQIVFPIAMFVHSSESSQQPRDEFHRSRLAETDFAEKIPSWGQVGESHELRDVALKVLEGCQRGPGGGLEQTAHM